MTERLKEPVERPHTTRECNECMDCLPADIRLYTRHREVIVPSSDVEPQVPVAAGWP